MGLFSRGGGSGGDPGDRVGGSGGPDEIRRVERTAPLARGTLACPDCDAPVSPGGLALAPDGAIECPYCGAIGRVREFLTLGAPTRAAHVVVNVRVPSSSRWRRARGPAPPSHGDGPRTPSA